MKAGPLGVVTFLASLGLLPAAGQDLGTPDLNGIWQVLNTAA